MFNYDWFTGPAFQQQKDLARHRCTRKKYPHLKCEDAEYQRFFRELEARTLLYLRDGFSYELKELVDVGLKAVLTFECEPADDQYKVGAFVVSLLFDEVVRVEVYAVHPKEKPEDMPTITGFRNAPQPMGMPQQREDSREG